MKKDLETKEFDRKALTIEIEKLTSNIVLTFI